MYRDHKNIILTDNRVFLNKLTVLQHLYFQEIELISKSITAYDATLILYCYCRLFSMQIR